MDDTSRAFSKNQIRKLGSRLRNAGVPAQEDVSAYILWSQGFVPALSEVEAKVREIAERGPASGDFEMSARIKQISSVRAKLTRLRTSLSDLEDIAGCRVILPSLLEVDAFTLECAKLRVTRTRDYRTHDRNGYRAVHLTIRGVDGRAVELQVRTKIEHAWAQLTERAAAALEPEVKYGGGPPETRDLLRKLSSAVRFIDVTKRRLSVDLARMEPLHTQLSQSPDALSALEQREHLELLMELETRMISEWDTIFVDAEHAS